MAFWRQAPLRAVFNKSPWEKGAEGDFKLKLSQGAKHPRL